MCYQNASWKCNFRAPNFKNCPGGMLPNYEPPPQTNHNSTPMVKINHLEVRTAYLNTKSTSWNHCRGILPNSCLHFTN